MPRNQQFEIPQELRHLAEDNVEHARKLYLQFMEGISQAWLTPSADRTPPGFNQIRERAIKITRENADAAFNLARDVANAHGDNLGDAKSHRPLASGWLLRNVGANTDSGLWASSSRSHARGGRDCREASAECPRNAVMFLMRSG